MSTPTNLEQEMLEMINRARLNPSDEYNNLILNTNPVTGVTADVTAALTFFNVDLNLFRQQLQSSASVAPLAWNSNLDNAADQHSALMIQFDMQSHQLPGEADLGGRLQANGYSYTFAGENIFAFATDAIDAHAAFYIDWANTPTGMLDPPGHRNNILSANFVEIGIGAIASSDPTKMVGPLVVTEDFGNRSNYAPQVLGVVFSDSNNNHFYNAGEGLGGVTVTLTGTGGTFSTTTWSSGGYQLAVPSGTYTETFSGGGLHATKSTQVTITNANVQVDDNDALSGATIAASTIQNDYLAITRTALPLDQATTVVNAIAAGLQTETQYVNGLLSQVANTTIPAVAVEASMYGVTGTSAEITSLTVNFLPAQVANATHYGLNPQVYACEALGLVFAFGNETGSTAFANNFGPSNSAMPNTAAGDAAFATAASSTIFGSASTANLVNVLQAFVANWKAFYTAHGVPGFATPTAAQIDLASRGAAWGDMDGVALATNLGPLNGQTINFLEDAAQGTAIYGASLIGQPAHQPFQGA